MGMIGGVSVGLIGGTAYAYGRMDEHKGLEVGGIVGMALGATAILVALPLLGLGTTKVRDAKGTRVAADSAASWDF
jgi:hypothetical protein